MAPRPASRDAWRAAALYAATAVVMTWPVARVAGSQIASDMGDPVFNSWVLMWTGGQVLDVLHGHPGALAGYWDANIFFPEPLTLAFSEHLTPQMVQALPVYAATGNIILSYNLLFLSTFVLSGLGAYLLVRDLTGRPLAALVAGLAFAWAPYRMAHLSHLQVLSSAWMPFALLGYRRYLDTRRLRPLAGGTLALIAQNLSCGYYLLYFPPFAAAFCLYEMARRRLLGDWPVWRGLAASAVVAMVVTWPFVQPYLDLKIDGEVGVRTLAEIQEYSADAHALATPSALLRVTSAWLTGYPRGEGEAFPGVTIVLLAAVAVGGATARGLRDLRRAALPGWMRAATLSAAAVLVVAGGLSLWFLVAGRISLHAGRTWVVYSGTRMPLWTAVGVGAVLVAILIRARRAEGLARGSVVFPACAAIAAVLLAFGPTIEAGGRTLAAGPYAWLLAFAPGFDGARAPARFFMVATLFLSVLAGIGAAALFDRLRRPAAAAAVFGVLILTESWIAPMPMARPVGTPDRLVSPTSLIAGRDVSRTIYGVVRSLPDPVVLVEFPFGEPAIELQAIYYAGFHRRPLLNGYSGYFPPSYGRRAGSLWDVAADPEGAAETLAASGATHALVHEELFAGEDGRAVSAWLESLGARLMASDGPRRLFVLR